MTKASLPSPFSCYTYIYDNTLTSSYFVEQTTNERTMASSSSSSSSSAAAAATATATSASAVTRRRRLGIWFIHPDLGIGGAERLVVDAAVGLQQLGHRVAVFTSHCDRSHCFDEARDGTYTPLLLPFPLPLPPLPLSPSSSAPPPHTPSALPIYRAI